MTHNLVFTRLVSDSEDKLLGVVACGIYKTAKREWILASEQATGHPPTAAEISTYAAIWTPQLIQNATDAASSALAEFASTAIDDARPDILKEALKGGTARTVLLGMVSALLYTIFLVLVVIALKASGIDLFSITKTIGK